MPNKSSFIDSYGYVMADAPAGHPRARCKGTGSGVRGGSTGYVREHVLVMEDHIGRLLTDDEVVHHIDGDKTNNDISNLLLMTKHEHSKLHWNNPRKREGTPGIGEKCAGCLEYMLTKWDGKRGLCNACYLKAKRLFKKVGEWPNWACKFSRPDVYDVHRRAA